MKSSHSNTYIQEVVKIDHIKIIQNYCFELLCYLDEICTENDITYYLASGTALGAVRHKGFIPWDDDVDVMMPRPDYEKFIEVTKEKPHDRYKFYCVHNEEKWTAPLAKLIDTHTKLNQVGHREKMDLGLYIDVFVLDGVPANSAERKRFFRKLDILQKLWGGCEYKQRPLKKGVLLKNMLKNVISILLNLFTNGHKVSKLIHKELKRYPFHAHEYIGTNDYAAKNREDLFFSKAVLGMGIRQEFEGGLFTIPQKYDLYLKKMYGDYQKLPPENERMPHHNYMLEFIK